jgi:hypothetical protein
MKLSTAFALLGAASTAFPGASAHEVAALRGFLPDDIKFLGNAANCYDVASKGCKDYGVNSCDNLQNSGCGCIWDKSLSKCVNDSCSRITNANAAVSVCESSTKDCTWNYNSNKCQSNGGGDNRSCNTLNFQSCRNTNGCTFIEPANANSYCVSVVNAGDYCDSSPNNQSQNKCEKAGCQWYFTNGNNGICDIPCSNVEPSYTKPECKASGCSFNKNTNFCDYPNYVFDFEAALESSN